MNGKVGLAAVMLLVIGQPIGEMPVDSSDSHTPGGSARLGLAHRTNTDKTKPSSSFQSPFMCLGTPRSEGMLCAARLWISFRMVSITTSSPALELIIR